LLGQRLAGVRGAHWSMEGRDWHGASTPETVRERLSARLVPGAVVVLHDAGPGARVTVPLLPDLLSDLRARGYRSVRLDALDGAGAQGGPELKRRAFTTLDTVFDRLGHIRYSGGRADNLFRVGPARFPLHGIRLNDGTPVPHGAPAAEFHVNNALIVDIGPRRAVRQGPTDFGALARDLLDRPELRDTEYIFCLSSLAPLLALVGFETHPLPAQDARRLRGWAEVLRRAYGSAQGAQEPKLSILSRQRFEELFARD
ncbi:MAG: polysaccharide deacetylase family protein, partial [Deinococcus sp.]|nr:polysaccharide deacetylase family protein [Deinococcus sp.]